MDTFQAIRERRSLKHYDPAHRMTQEEEDKLIDLAMQAPSSFNIQHWRLVKIIDPDLRKQIRAAAADQAQVTEASLLFVITADVKAWEKNPQRYWRNAPQAVQDVLVPWVKPFYEGKEQLQRDEAMRSVGFIAQTMMLAAKAMGYDSCPMIGFDADKVAQIINLPQDHVIGMMLAIGKATKPAWPKPGFIERKEMVIENKFGT
ncbi:MAG: nitroreductase family protein [Alphaproteobacteria bacterium]|nr:nitroreductase family protein [Alphaproteobacteria bacterium]MBP7760035.1 nitroreductase family protein [Alphaproteobacteria bacterium]MBP7763394.1 nitroreductase family protein [Alphaproteobacteria bacterium]MBP7905981.1 nitroreductase family protein [Alphaproteobacteria bacterium]